MSVNMKVVEPCELDVRYVLKGERPAPPRSDAELNVQLIDAESSKDVCSRPFDNCIADFDMQDEIVLRSQSTQHGNHIRRCGAAPESLET